MVGLMVGLTIAFMIAETERFLPRPARRFFRVASIRWQNVAALVILSVGVFAQAAGQSFKIEQAGPARAEIPYNLRKGLEKNGIRLSCTVNGIDFPLAELWPVRNLPVRSLPVRNLKMRPSGETPGAADYQQLTPGKPLAVLYLPKAILDFKLQKVSPGFYVLRYAQLDLDTDEDDAADKRKPDNTQNTAPNNATNNAQNGAQYHDVVSLVRLESARLESDKKPGADLSSRADHASGKAVEVSTQDVAGQKTALLALPPLNPAYKMFPYAVSDDRGHCAVQFKLSVRLASGRTDEMGIAILLVNPPNLSEED